MDSVYSIKVYIRDRFLLTTSSRLSTKIIAFSLLFTVPTTSSSSKMSAFSFTCLHACSVAGVLARPFECKS